MQAPSRQPRASERTNSSPSSGKEACQGARLAEGRRGSGAPSAAGAPQCSPSPRAPQRGTQWRPRSERTSDQDPDARWPPHPARLRPPPARSALQQVAAAPHAWGPSRPPAPPPPQALSTGVSSAPTPSRSWRVGTQVPRDPQLERRERRQQVRRAGAREPPAANGGARLRPAPRALAPPRALRPAPCRPRPLFCQSCLLPPHRRCSS